MSFLIANIFSTHKCLFLGIYTPAEIPIMTSTTSSITTEKITKFSSSTSSNFNEVFLPPAMEPYNNIQSQTAAPVAQKPQVPQKQAPAASPKPYQSAPQVYVPKQPPQIVKTSPPTISPGPVKTASPRNDTISPRSGVSASSVTPGILKKQLQLDAAVPIPPCGSIQSPITVGSRSGGKSPVPIFNTSPAPFGFPALSIQTPETIAQAAPSPLTPLVPALQNPKPLPFIVSTPLPQYTSSYNTAARPFGQTKDFYRPIQMDSVKKLFPPVVYTDF